MYDFVVSRVCVNPLDRTCNTCLQSKPLKSFDKNKNSKGGHLPVCSKCAYLKNKHRYTPEYRRKYRNPSKSQLERDKYRFGGNRKLVLERDGYKCVKCNMSNENHIAIFGRNLTVDHIDNKGRYSVEKNHALDNLQTLCFRCHGKKDAVRKLTDEQVIELRKMASEGYKKSALAKKFGVSWMYVWYLVNNVYRVANMEGLKVKHTAGPWSAVRGIVIGNGYELADCRASYVSKDESLANAHLIASAPELLRVCKEILDNHGKMTDLDELEMVIKRAEGRA